MDINTNARCISLLYIVQTLVHLVGNLTLHNTGLDAKRLKPNPITLTNSSTIAIVKHEDHGMYQNTNNVTIAGVESGITTTLNTAITADTNTVVLAFCN